MTREEATKLADAFCAKAGRLQHLTRAFRAFLDDPTMIQQWGVAHLVDAHLNRISLASADMHGFIKNTESKLRTDPAVDPVRHGRRAEPATSAV
jgi:hypothetical protein